MFPEKKKIRFATGLDPIKQIKLVKLFLTCAPISELPSNISTTPQTMGNIMRHEGYCRLKKEEFFLTKKLYVGLKFFYRNFINYFFMHDLYCRESVKKSDTSAVLPVLPVQCYQCYQCYQCSATSATSAVLPLLPVLPRF